MISQQELYLQIQDHLLNDEKPSHYLNTVSEQPVFHEQPFSMLIRLKDAEQSPKHHPEGNVWNHTMLVVDMAAEVKEKSRNRNAFLWAALLHDIGKPDTTRVRKGKITSYNHEKVGAELAGQFLTEFTSDRDFIQSVTSLVRWHMQLLFVTNDLPFSDIKSMVEQVDLNEIALLGFCDRMGRLGADRVKEEENIRVFLKKCRSAAVS